MTRTSADAIILTTLHPKSMYRVIEIMVPSRVSYVVQISHTAGPKRDPDLDGLPCKDVSGSSTSNMLTAEAVGCCLGAVLTMDTTNPA